MIKLSFCRSALLAGGAFLLAGMVAFTLCQAQQPGAPQPGTTLKQQARTVLLPVVVIDKHGALVANLTANDFTLTEDGRPQAITSLTTQSALPFRLGLMVDTSRGVYPAMDAERKAAEKFIEQILPADPKAGDKGNQAFLIHFDREVELLEDFTASREKLDHEIDQMRPTAAEHSEQGTETSGSNGGDGQRTGREQGGAQLYDAIYLASDELMKPVDGRKALVVFSDGADHGSKETLNDAIDAADRANLQVFTIYFKGEPERGTAGNPGGGHRGGISIGGWPGGSGWPGGGNGNGSPRSEAGVDGKRIMQQIAARTGGQFFEAKKKEDLDRIYGDIANLLHQQYLLTYTPDKVDTDGEFHKIVLKTNRSDVSVYTREGYYAPGAEGQSSVR